VKLLDPQGALCAPKGQGANEVSAAIRRAQRAGSVSSANQMKRSEIRAILERLVRLAADTKDRPHGYHPINAKARSG